MVVLTHSLTCSQKLNKPPESWSPLAGVKIKSGEEKAFYNILICAGSPKKILDSNIQKVFLMG